MITARQLLAFLRHYADSEAPSILDRPLFATFGNDQDGRAVPLVIEKIVPAGDPKTNGLVRLPFEPVEGTLGNWLIECPDLVLVLGRSGTADGTSEKETPNTGVSMNDPHKPVATLLVGAEGAAETEGQPWIRPATAEEERAFIDGPCKADEDHYQSSLIDGTGRPYFLLTVLDNAPEQVQTKAKRCAGCLRLTE